MARRLAKTILYQSVRSLFGVVIVGYLRCQWRNGHFVPDRGPVVLVANHQSHLDPILVGVGCRRRLSYFARKTLFVGVFGQFIELLDAIPVDRNRSSVSGLKETLRRLKSGGAILIFPEGTRTHDGQIGPLLPGFCSLARRSGATIVPLGIAGAFDAWPRSARFPRPGRVAVQFGEPIDVETIAHLNDPDLMEMICCRLDACYDQAVTRVSSR